MFRRKLTKEQVSEILSRYIPYHYSCNKLSIEYGVGRSTIQKIVLGRNS